MTSQENDYIEVSDGQVSPCKSVEGQDCGVREASEESRKSREEDCVLAHIVPIQAEIRHLAI